MVPPSFGFSAGDFVAAIELTIKIGKAIRETGGATTEYRLVSQDLQLLRQVLEITQALQLHGANAGHVNAIRRMGLTCLREFAEKLDNRYSSALSVGSAKNAFSRCGKKAQVGHLGSRRSIQVPSYHFCKDCHDLYAVGRMQLVMLPF